VPTPAPKYIYDGVWVYNFTVQSNTCGTGLAPGQSVPQMSIRFVDDERSDGYILAGDTVVLYQVDSSGDIWLGSYTFTYARFQQPGRYHLRTPVARPSQ
jgi:hypothetical protein